uniref:protein FAR1-RELATED SEQUENCE 5-like n=1 Tax=Erigeron canadensis TaxID=72917 RepID=UPI001CB8DD2D|nr:protein FAR1-RELATED SEQUENCE 5-like [Erigeron canadensis]
MASRSRGDVGLMETFHGGGGVERRWRRWTLEVMMDCLEKIFLNPNAPEGVNDEFVYEELDDEFESPDVRDEFDYDHDVFYNKEVFDTHIDLVDWAQRTAKELGYVLVTRRSNVTKGGEVKKVVLICNRGGKKDKRSTGAPKGSTKIDCPFKLVGRLTKDHSWWVEVIDHRHNHPSACNLEGIAYARRLTDVQKEFVDEKALLGFGPNSIRDQLKDAFPGILTRSQDISNYLQQHRLKHAQQRGETRMQIVLQLLSDHQYTYQYTTDSKTGCLTNLFFVHPTSLDIWRAFPWIIEIDATYKTNVYNMPLVEIVGVTPTGKTFSIAHALIENEQHATYTWVLQCLRSTLEEGFVVRVALTDRDLALMKAVKDVMPETKLILCRIHIWRNIELHANPSFGSKKIMVRLDTGGINS